MANSNEGLVLHLKLDESTQIQVSDTPNISLSGTLVGNPQLLPDDAFGSRLRFDGVEDYLDLGNPPQLQLSGNQTIAMWLKPDDFNERRNPYAKAYDGEGTITQEKDGRLTYYYGGGEEKDPYQGFQTTAPIALNQWTHIAVIRDLDNSKLYWYINGALTDEASAKYPLAKIGSQPAYVGKGYVQNYAGSIAHVRIYNRALTAVEIEQDMTEDKTAASSFRQNYPLDFEAYDSDDQALIAIADDLEGRTLRLEIDNSSPQTIQLTPSSNGSEATAVNHHFELRFRPGVLSKASQSQISLAETANWNMSGPQLNANGDISLYFLNIAADPADQTVAPAERIVLTLHRISADGGGGPRGTRLELKYQQLTYAGDSTPLSGSRMQRLNIVNHLGRKNIPLHVSFVGSNTVLNDGRSVNELTVHITNVLKGQALALNPDGVSGSPPSKFVLSFDVQAEDEEKEWALGTTSQVQGIEVTTTNVNLGAAQNKLDAAKELLAKAKTEAGLVQAQITLATAQKKSTTTLQQKLGEAVKKIGAATEVVKQAQEELIATQAIQWRVKEETQGESPEWVLTTPNKTTLDPEEAIQINLSNIITSLPSGHTNLYIHYENIPGYWDGQFVVSIEKSPLIYQGQNIGVGTTNPQAKLQITNGDILLDGDAQLRFGDTAAAAKMQGKDLNVPGQLTGKSLDIEDNVKIGRVSSVPSGDPKFIISSDHALAALIQSSHPKGAWLQVVNTSEEKDNVWNIISTGSEGSGSGEGGSKLLFKKGMTGPNQVTFDSSGNVGIGADNPKTRLHVSGGTDVAKDKANSGFLIIGDAAGAHLAMDNNEIMAKADGKKTGTLYLQYEGGGTSIGGDLEAKKITADSIDTNTVEVDKLQANEINVDKVNADEVNVTTANADEVNVTVANADVVNVTKIKADNISATKKDFVIEHPLKPGYQLRHSCLEGPEVGVYYRGTARLENGEATIVLPDYFEALTRKDARTVHLTAIGREPFLLSYEAVQDGQFKVYAARPDGAFSWQVTAVRADVAELEVEVKA